MTYTLLFLVAKRNQETKGERGPPSLNLLPRREEGFRSLPVFVGATVSC